MDYDPQRYRCVGFRKGWPGSQDFYWAFWSSIYIFVVCCHTTYALSLFPSRYFATFVSQVEKISISIRRPFYNYLLSWMYRGTNLKSYEGKLNTMETISSTPSNHCGPLGAGDSIPLDWALISSGTYDSWLCRLTVAVRLAPVPVPMIGPSLPRRERRG